MVLKNCLLVICCSRLAFVNWLQNHLLPCPFKYLTGIDCPGCGFQRSVLALVQGNLHKSFILYPATFPLLSLFILGIAGKYFKLDNAKNSVKKTLLIFTGIIILVSYGIKLWGYANHKTSA